MRYYGSVYRPPSEARSLIVQVTYGSPYGAFEEVEHAAREICSADVDLVVLDCIGYTVAMKEKVREITGLPVVLSRTIAARTIMELLT